MSPMYRPSRLYIGGYNLFLFFLSLIILGLAIFVGLEADNLTHDITACVVFCMTSIMLGLSFAGCCGALLESVELLFLNAYVTSMVAILSFRIYVMTYSPWQLNNVKELLVAGLTNYYNRYDLENKFQCCVTPWNQYRNNEFYYCAQAACEMVISQYVLFFLDIVRGISQYIFVGGVLAAISTLYLSNEASKKFMTVRNISTEEHPSRVVKVLRMQPPQIYHNMNPHLRKVDDIRFNSA